MKPSRSMQKGYKKASGPQLKTPASKVAFTGILGALALALAALENLLPPIPVLPPGAKLGLSNTATMYAAQSVGLLPALCIALIKGLFAGMTRGTAAMLMSLSGGICSTVLMWFIVRRRVPVFGWCGVGVIGSLAHNGAQLCVAALLTSPAVAFYIPWLILFGMLSGILTGLVLRVMLPVLNMIPLPQGRQKP